MMVDLLLYKTIYIYYYFCVDLIVSLATLLTRPPLFVYRPTGKVSAAEPVAINYETLRDVIA